MNPRLSKEVTDALHTSGDVPLPVVDPTNNKVYFIVDQELSTESLQALKRQQDLAAIQEGYEQSKAGLGIPHDEAMQQVYDHLNALPEK